MTPFFGKLKEGEELLFLKRWSDLATFFSCLFLKDSVGPEVMRTSTTGVQDVLWRNI